MKMYIVIKTYNAKELVGRVNNAMRDGWQPFGSLNTNVVDECVEYLQAMYGAQTTA